MVDIAVPRSTGYPAGGIEACQCRIGYSGNSCQECSVGYYRDPSDRSQGPLGKCKQCDCNGNEQSCNLDAYSGQLVCTCKPGYSGQMCEVAGTYEDGHGKP